MPETLAVRAPDGTRLAVTIDGEGPPLLLIPGLGSARHVFDPITPALARRHRVIVYDPRGVGESEAGSATLTMPLLAGDAVAVLDAADASRADVLGASMGGIVAQHVALGQGAHVRRLILAATAPGGEHAVPADSRATAALFGKGARTPAEAYRMACTVLYSVKFQRTHAAFIEEQIQYRAAHPVRGRVFSAQIEALRTQEDVFERLSSLRVPTLVTHGTLDAVAPFENAQLLAARIPGAQTRWFEECGHLFFHERPGESARVIDEFLRAEG